MKILPPRSVFSSRQIRTSLLVLALLALGAWSQAGAVEPKVEEALSFEILRLPVNHQGPQVFDVAVRLAYQANLGEHDYPDFEAVEREIRAFLAAYPNEKDYLEVVNKHLCLTVLAHYPKLAAVAIDLHVYPTMTVPYAQTSHCTATR